MRHLAGIRLCPLGSALLACSARDLAATWRFCETKRSSLELLNLSETGLQKDHKPLEASGTARQYSHECGLALSVGPRESAQSSAGFETPELGPLNMWALFAYSLSKVIRKGAYMINLPKLVGVALVLALIATQAQTAAAAHSARESQTELMKKRMQTLFPTLSS